MPTRAGVRSQWQNVSKSTATVNVQVMVFMMIKKKEEEEDTTIPRGYLTYLRPHSQSVTNKGFKARFGSFPNNF